MVWGYVNKIMGAFLDYVKEQSTLASEDGLCYIIPLTKKESESA